jgi:hypothetical protein
MSEFLKLNEEEWSNLNNILLSVDEESVNLGFGLLKNVDYTNKEQIELFEDYLHLFLATPSTEEYHNKIKAKYMHYYFEALENFTLSNK